MSGRVVCKTQGVGGLMKKIDDCLNEPEIADPRIQAGALMTETSVISQSGQGHSHGIVLSELILLTVFALISVAVKQMMRLDLNLPGHSYIVYLFCLVFGPLYVNKRGAAAWMGVVAGIFAVISGSRKGVLDIFRFCMPAVFLEITRFLPTLGHPLVNRIVEGVTAALVMHVTKSALNLITGKPLEVVMIKFYPGLVTYPVIGCACGACAYFMYKAVLRYKS